MLYRYQWVSRLLEEDGRIKASSKHENSYSELGGPVLTPDFGQWRFGPKSRANEMTDLKKRAIGGADVISPGIQSAKFGEF
jgi:hypothetical protein